MLLINQRAMDMKAAELVCTVESFKMLTPTVFETHFQTNLPLEFLAGQFVSVIIPGAGPSGRDLRRAYSIASSPETKPIQLCIKIVEEGPGTQYIHQLRAGSTFKVMAPYGDFLYKPKPNRHACFIATGTGIAPFRSMMTSKHFKENPPLSSLCLLGVRTEDELLYENIFKSLPNAEHIQAVSQPTAAWNGFKGRVTDYLRGITLSDFPWLETEYYLCGHGGMINEVKAFLADKGVLKDSLHQEIYYK